MFNLFSVFNLTLICIPYAQTKLDYIQVSVVFFQYNLFIATLKVYQQWSKKQT